MYALTLRRPWARAVLEYGKDIENRDWATEHRGPLIVHAGKSTDNVTGAWPSMHYPAHPGEQGFVGLVDVVGCHPASECEGSCSEWAQRHAGFHWQLADPRRFDAPIPGRGFLGLFVAPPAAVGAACRLEPGTPDDLVDSVAAAPTFGVSPITIRTWAHRYGLPTYGRESRRTLYSLAHLMRVEASCRTTRVA